MQINSDIIIEIIMIAAANDKKLYATVLLVLVVTD